MHIMCLANVTPPPLPAFSPFAWLCPQVEHGAPVTPWALGPGLEPVPLPGASRPLPCLPSGCLEYLWEQEIGNYCVPEMLTLLFLFFDKSGRQSALQNVV